MRTLTERLGSDLRDLWTDEDTVEFTIDGSRNVDVLTTLRDDPDLAFFMLADAAAVDYGVGAHFEVVYHLFSWKHPAWLRVRARVDRADPRIRTITHLWEGAMFHEREMYDMMGIVFEGNRDLRRIYMSPRLPVLPAAQGLPAARRRRRLLRPRREPARAAGDVGPHAASPTRPRRARTGDSPAAVEAGEPTPTGAVRDDEGRSRGPHPGPDRAGPRRGGAPARGRRAARRPASRRSTPASSRSASRTGRRRPSASGRSTPSKEGRCSSTWGRSTPRRTASCAWS